MADAKYKCDECNLEFSVGYIRFHRMVDESYKLKRKNKILLEFAKEIIETEPHAQLVWLKARKLLKKLGEIG